MKKYTIRKQNDSFGKSWVINEKYVIYADGVVYHLDIGRGDFPQYVFAIRDELIKGAK